LKILRETYIPPFPIWQNLCLVCFINISPHSWASLLTFLTILLSDVKIVAGVRAHNFSMGLARETLGALFFSTLENSMFLLAW
jgi:hypothetical protein